MNNTAQRKHRHRQLRCRTLVFRDRVGRPLRRSNSRRRAWLPALVRAGLVDQVVAADPHRYRAIWPDRDGVEWSAEFTTEREAVACVAAKAVGGMRFHDLRHAHATWLVTDGVLINLVQRVMGHEQASTTLNRYTHTPHDYAARVLEAFDGSAASGRGNAAGGPPRRGRRRPVTCGGALPPERDDPRRGESDLT